MATIFPLFISMNPQEEQTGFFKSVWWSIQMWWTWDIYFVWIRPHCQYFPRRSSNN